ncbi:ribosomal protein S2 [Xylaria sp. FL1777]|nr:ribosomal protein S2 [Xylaria sp. FL1777]
MKFNRHTPTTQCLSPANGYRRIVKFQSRKTILTNLAVIGQITVTAMIIREFGVRHARRALAQPARQACCPRAPSTQSMTTMTTTTTTTQPMVRGFTQDAIQTPASEPTSKPPAIFIANAKSARRRRPDEVDKTAELYHQGQLLKRQIGKVGTHVEKTYRPSDLFFNSPGPKDVTLELLMASQAHMGHHTSLWNPANARYIFGIRQGIHIISLEQIAAHLRRAARVVEEVAYRGGLILFVGTRPGHAQLVTQAAQLARACHLFTKWTPGSITNSDVILSGMEIQMLDENDKPLEGYDIHLNERRPLVPDLVVCLNPLENYTLLRECAVANVPTIGVIDTNTEPTWVTYAIPANDDSLRCLAVIGSVLGRAGETGHKRRLEDAKLGVVEWRTPLDVRYFMSIKRKIAEREAERNSRPTNEDETEPASTTSGLS